MAETARESQGTPQSFEDTTQDTDGFFPLHPPLSNNLRPPSYHSLPKPELTTPHGTDKFHLLHAVPGSGRDDDQAELTQRQT